MSQNTEPTPPSDTTDVDESVDVAMIGVGAVFGTKQSVQADAIEADAIEADATDGDSDDSGASEPEPVDSAASGLAEQVQMAVDGGDDESPLEPSEVHSVAADDNDLSGGSDVGSDAGVDEVAEAEIEPMPASEPMPARESVPAAEDETLAEPAQEPTVDSEASEPAPTGDVTEPTELAEPAGGAVRKQRSSKAPDAACVAAVDIAREALLEVVPSSDLGEHLGAERSGDRLVVHSFAATLKGYHGWVWKVLVARASRARVVTTCDSWLEPGPESMLAPAWVPWADRLEPDDVRPTDRLPYAKEDVRLMDNRFCTDEEAINDVDSWVVDTTKPRVLSPEGADEAATRWQKNELSGTTRSARQASATCGSCGFFVAITGVLGQQFGVCANGWSDADSNVVNVDYGCGAHSETDVDRESEPISEPVLDESGFEVITD